MTFFKRLLPMLALLALAACGGGSNSTTSTQPFGGTGSGTGTGTGGGTGGTAGSPTLTVAVNPTTVTAASPGVVTAQIMTAAGAGIPGQVVQFTTQSGLGALSAPSALTDANGTATVTLKPASALTTGADLVQASATVSGTTLTASGGFQLTATNFTIASFTADIGTTALAPYGQTTLTAALSAGASGTPVNLSVSSTCVTQGLATLTPASTTTTTGSATFTYRDNGCGANGTDSLQASVAGSSATASLKLMLTAPTPASFAFVSAAPGTIYLKGSGAGSESSTVTFQVRDQNGNGVAGQTVQIDPTTLAGGIQINGVSDPAQFPLSTVSDSNGNVVVYVNSGTVPTPVRVKASMTVNGSTISTVSSALSIAVGLPSEINYSLSQGVINIEGYNRDGTTNTYTVIASDRLGNPVPDGTTANFIAEGGQVQATVKTTTANGLSSATANFQSAAPRPADGRVTVMSYALGEKSFIDENGDNVFTAADTHQWFQDLGDPYLDTLYNGVYGSAAAYQVIPQSPTGTSACNTDASPSTLPASLQLTVSIPSHPNTCTGSWGSAYVRRAVETIFSTSSARPVWGTSWPTGSAVSGASCPSGLSLIRPNLPPSLPAYDASGNPQLQTYYPFGGAGLYLGASATSGVVSFLVADANPVAMNPVAAKSTIAVSATAGLTVNLVGGSPVPSTSAPSSAAVSYSFASGASTGTITVTITSPSGVATTVSQFIAAADPPAGYHVCP